MSVKLDEVDRALARLWDAQAEGAASAHAQTVNLFALCAGADEAKHAREVLEAVLPYQPGRGVLAAVDVAGSPSVDADVGLVCDRTHANAPCSELVTLGVHSGARAWLPSVFERLRASDAPVYLWWVGDLPHGDRLFDDLVGIADVVVVNSAEMDLEDLPTLAAYARRAEGRGALADLAWGRLRSWQELLARFFDDPAVRPQLAGARTLVITEAPPRQDSPAQPAGTQAALFAAWFAARIGARASEARWYAAHEAVLPRPGGALTLRFETRARADVTPGALLAVRLETDGGSHFELARHDEPRVLGWSGTCAGAVIPQAVVRVGVHDDARLFARLLQSPVHDGLYLATLFAAADLIAAPSATPATPRR